MFDTIQPSFMVEILRKLRVKKKNEFFNLKKNTKEKSTAAMLFHGRTLNIVLLRSKARLGYVCSHQCTVRQENTGQV